jgi:predicted tellurium resistance membrane protein TerC
LCSTSACSIEPRTQLTHKEQALPACNIFVFLLVFSYLPVPAKYQHRVLFWGLLRALLMRRAMNTPGSYLIAGSHWILYLLGAFLVITAVRMATQDEDAQESVPIETADSDLGVGVFAHVGSG